MSKFEKKIMYMLHVKSKRVGSRVMKFMTNLIGNKLNLKINYYGISNDTESQLS
ncbi:hypothetical protein [Clostridium botulinum]|uniref:hypothetical protein n=1 Tax=Clostridium botulinum TaxID=1491 RepID=UPI000325F2D6|nr:hypothetical protein [Clostridium botulinum]